MRLRSQLWAAAVLVGAMAGESRAELRKASPALSSTKTDAVVVGNVKSILDGTSTGTNVLRVEPEIFTAALGAATLTPDPAGQGETLVLGRNTFVKSVDPAEQYATTSSLSGFWTGFAAGIPRDARPVARYQIAGQTESMETIYRDLAKVHGPLFAVLARGHFERLETSAVERAPCWGEPILGANKDRYFHKSGVLENVEALTFGLVLRSAEEATSGTERIFYINPDDRGATGVLSHTHFARLRSGDGVDLREPGKAASSIEDIAHLLTQSRMTRGELEVYELKGVTSQGERSEK